MKLRKCIIMIVIFFILGIITNIVLWSTVGYIYNSKENITQEVKQNKIKEEPQEQSDKRLKYLNAERYTMLMGNNLIDFKNLQATEVINYINKTFDDNLKEIKKETVKSDFFDYNIISFKSKDNSILVLYTENNICISYEWKSN